MRCSCCNEEFHPIMFSVRREEEDGYEGREESDVMDRDTERD